MIFIGDMQSLREMLLDLSVDEKRAKHAIQDKDGGHRIVAVTQIRKVGNLCQFPDREWGYCVVLDTGESLFPSFHAAADALRDRLYLTNKIQSWLSEPMSVSEEVH